MKRILLLLSIAFLSAGCGRAKRAAGDAASAAAGATKAVAGKAGHAVGEHVGTFFAAVGEGVEQSVCDYETRVDDPALEAAGVSVTLVRRVTGDDRTPALSLYLLNGRPVAGTLRVRLLAADGREAAAKPRSTAPPTAPATSASPSPPTPPPNSSAPSRSRSSRPFLESSREVRGVRKV